MKAGVVPSTVSLVLNGKSKQMRISDELAKKIKAIAEETGYIPNQTAVSLRTGRSNILGLIVEDISNVFFASLAKVIEDEVTSLGFKIVYCSTDNNDKKGCELIKVLLHRQVDGFLITPSAGMHQEVKKLVELKKPVVLMDRYFPQLQNSYVLVDNYGGVQQGVEHLIQKGHRNIAFVTNNLDQNQMHERKRAFSETMQKHGLAEGESQVLRLPYECRSEEAVAAINEFLGRVPRFDAVFFATNYLGVYGLESVQQLGYTIPQDLAMVCFDDHALFRLMAPGITCIRQPIEAIASTAVDFLLQQLADPALPQEKLQELKKPELIIRGSA